MNVFKLPFQFAFGEKVWDETCFQAFGKGQLKPVLHSCAMIAHVLPTFQSAISSVCKRDYRPRVT
jgi:hypothetical protein